MIIVYIALAIVLAAVIHEGGHWLAALCLGYKLKFRLAWAWKIIPRGVWDMPDVERWKQQVIAIAGFGAEFLAVPIFYAIWAHFAPWYGLAAAVHCIAYPFYAGSASDFKWLA